MNKGIKSDRVVERIVGELLNRGGRPTSIGDGSNLMQAGLTSQDGVELACDLEARLGITVPGDFNPLVHERENRMRTLGELKAWARAQQPTPAKKGA
ncbi:MAG: acyl carrier protein [Planctomycetes bacterium]|nr:acyl carrier protein [Planctomycetota bacterium]